MKKLIAFFFENNREDSYIMFTKQDDKCMTIENLTPWKMFTDLVSNEDHNEKEAKQSGKEKKEDYNKNQKSFSVSKDAFGMLYRRSRPEPLVPDL